MRTSKLLAVFKTREEALAYAKQLSMASGPAGGYVVAVEGDAGQFPGGEEVHEDDVGQGKAACATCLGTGNCPACEGKGEGDDGLPCPACAGSGECPDCAGLGTVDKIPEQMMQAPEEGVKMATRSTRKGSADNINGVRVGDQVLVREGRNVYEATVHTLENAGRASGQKIHVKFTEGPNKGMIDSVEPSLVSKKGLGMAARNNGRKAPAKQPSRKTTPAPSRGSRVGKAQRKAAEDEPAEDEEEKDVAEEENPDDLLDSDEDRIADESEKEVTPEQEPNPALDADSDDTLDLDEGSAGEPFVPKHSARVITTAYAHAKGEDDYLQNEVRQMDNPDAVKALQKYHSKFVAPRMEHLKDLLHEHHGQDEQHAGLGPDELLDKHLKALEAEQAGPLEGEGEIGEDNLVDAGDVPPDAVAGEEGGEAEPFAGEETPEEEALEHEELGKEEGPGGDADTQEILERYRDKAGRWHTRKVGTVRRTKDGRAFLVRTKSIRGAYAVQERGGRFFVVDDEGNEAAGPFGSYRQAEDERAKMQAGGHRPAQKAPVDEPFNPAGGTGQDLDELNKAVGDAEEYLGDMAEDDELPRKHLAPVRYHAKRLGQVRKGLQDMGKFQASGGKGSELTDEGSCGNKGSLKDDTGWNKPGKGPSSSTENKPPEGEKRLSPAVAQRFDRFLGSLKTMGLDLGN